MAHGRVVGAGLRWDVTTGSLPRLTIALDRLNPQVRRRLLEGALRAAAQPIYDKARQANFGFRDRGLPRRYGAKYRMLRHSIRIVRGPRPRGRGAQDEPRAWSVTAGGSGAAHAIFVELGHGGPRPARPHPYLAEAAFRTHGQQFDRAVDYLRANIAEAVRRAGSEV